MNRNNMQLRNINAISSGIDVPELFYIIGKFRTRI